MESLKGKRQRGFTIIESLVVVSIMGIVALGAMNMIIESTKQVNFLQRQVDQLTLGAMITGNLARKSSCLTDVNGIEFNATSVEKLSTSISLNGLKAGNSADGFYLVRTEGSNLNSGSLVKSILIIPSIPLDNPEVPQSFEAKIVIEALEVKGQQRVRHIEVPIAISLDQSTPVANRKAAACSPAVASKEITGGGSNPNAPAGTDGALLFGGMYRTTMLQGTREPSCGSKNMATSSCSCPTGFESQMIGETKECSQSPGNGLPSCTTFTTYACQKKSA